VLLLLVELDVISVVLFVDELVKLFVGFEVIIALLVEEVANFDELLLVEIDVDTLLAVEFVVVKEETLIVELKANFDVELLDEVLNRELTGVDVDELAQIAEIYFNELVFHLFIFPSKLPLAK
jgi:hypothetical protein